MGSRDGNSAAKKKHYTKTLADNARRYGWLDGKRIGRDLTVKAKAKGIVDAVGPANGLGKLATTSRATFNDRTNGDQTVVDFGANFDFPVTDGKANVKTSADALLNGISQPSLPHCSSIETVTVNLVDPNGDAYGNIGLFLP